MICTNGISTAAPPTMIAILTERSVRTRPPASISPKTPTTAYAQGRAVGSFLWENSLSTLAISSAIFSPVADGAALGSGAEPVGDEEELLTLTSGFTTSGTPSIREITLNAAGVKRENKPRIIVPVTRAIRMIMSQVVSNGFAVDGACCQTP